MKFDETDNVFRHLFGELKLRDQGRTPAFAVMIRPRTQPIDRWRRWVMATSALLLAIACFDSDNRHHSDALPSSDHQWADAFFSWESPSDVLLTLPLAPTAAGNSPDIPVR